VSVLDPTSVLEQLRSTSRFLIQQVFKPIGNEYRISAPAPGSTEEGTPILFVKQKKLKIREDIRFRLSPEDDGHLFMIKSKTVFEFAGEHDVLDADGAQLGTLKKEFGKSLLRTHWTVRDNLGQVLFESYETSMPIAIIRRVAQFGPDWLDLLQFLPFNFTLSRDGQEVGTYKRVLGKLRDRYVLELGDGLADADRRVVLAFAVALDALQDR
jgi:uncharacterized protein YxjI